MKIRQRFGLTKKEQSIMEDFKQINRKNIIRYFEQGCKEEKTPLHFGLELEHFVVDKKSKKSIPYNGKRGMEELLERLRPRYPKTQEASGHLIGLSCEEYAVSLEPASQLEISIAPQESIQKIMSIYHKFRAEMESILQEWDFELVTKGYQIHDCVNQLPLIPKKRYEYMDRYFDKIGIYGKQMMRGTASTQISIDYYSEEDCTKKYYVAFALSDILAKLTENTPVYEGKPFDGHFLRRDIWKKTDKDRVDITPYEKDGEINFARYTDFLFDTPIIVDSKDGNDSYSEKTIGEICEERILSTAEMEHVLSMVFPIIRIKKYLEIRIADSMEEESVKCYLILMKGLFENIEATYQCIVSPNFLKGTWKEKLEELLSVAKVNLEEEEKNYLASFSNSILEEQTIIRKGKTDGTIFK